METLINQCFLFILLKHVEKEQHVGKKFFYKNITYSCILNLVNRKEQAFVYRRICNMAIVESDQVGQGKRIKIGNVIIIGTKPPADDVRQYA
jgi:hypothetical protein